MRRHVQGMRRRRRDFRVAPGGVEPSVGEWWVIVAMNQVMGHTGMLRLFREYPLEDFGGLELLGIGLITWRGGGVQGQGIEHRRLTILRIALGELFHCLFI